MIDAIAAEWLKFRTLRSNSYLLAASLLAVLLNTGIAYMVIRGWDGQGMADRLRFPSLGDGLGTGLSVAYFVIGALGALSITSEYGTGQIATSLTAVPRRNVLLLAKIPVLVAVGVVAGVILALGMHFATLAVLGDRASTVLLSGEPLASSGSLTGVLLAGAAAGPAAVIGLGLGAAIRSTAGTLVTLIMIVFVLPVAAQAMPVPLRSQLGSYMIDTLSTGGGLLDPWAAAGLLTAYTAAALGAGAVALAARGRRLKPLICGFIATGLFGSVLLAPPAGAGVSSSSLAWHACKSRDMQCSAVQVPVDWSKPGGRKITLPVVRLPHTGTRPRLGVVFSIPGGPGGSGVDDFVKRGAAFAQLRERFDVVSLAPRNAADLGLLSTDCLISGPWLTLPRTSREYGRLGRTVAEAAQRCRARDPELFDHADSASFARDIDAIRGVLGESRLSFIATSYGGLPALSYARLFPARVRALYLDGVVNPLLDRSASQRMRYAAIEGQFARFAAWCRTAEACVLRGQDVGSTWRELVARADRSPIPVAGTRVSYSGFDLKVAAAPDVITPGGPEYTRWKELADAIRQASRGDASGFADYVKAGTGSLKPPAAIGIHMTQCLDGFVYRDYASYRSALAEAPGLAPNFAGNESWHSLGCTGWPLPVSNPPGPLPAHGLPPLLGAGTWTDYADTADLALRVPGSGTIRFDGPGHGLYLSSDPCTIAHANRYLTTLEPPPPNTTCHPS